MTSAARSGAASGLRDAKVYRGGTHRSRRPEDTLAAILPLAERMGITRLANVTGLDRIGIPVCMACRPLSRSLAVSQGKGLTLAEAKVSAFMEAAETWHAETITAPLKMGSLEELRHDHRIIDVDGLPRSRLGAFDPQQQILWIEGRPLSGGEPLWVPLEMVSTNYTLPQPQGSFAFPANTNGLASGNSFAEAALHAVCELIERDALTLWRLGGDQARAATKMDPQSVDSAACRGVMEHFAKAGVEVGIWEATSDVGVAVFCCAVADPTDHSVEAEIGAGCHPDREIALLRALTEAAQARTTRIAGSRDDFVPESYGGAAKQARNRVARRWLSEPPLRRYADTPSLSGETIDGDLDRVLARLARCGIGQVVAVDLTKPEVGIPVVRVVAPGLEGAYQGEGSDYRPGARAAVRGLAGGDWS